MTKAWQKVVAVISGIGFAASFMWHVAARAGITGGLSRYSVVLFVGIFVVWFPTVFYLQRFQREMRGTFGLRGWKYIVMGAPTWMVWLAGISFVYGMINFLTVVPFERRHFSSSDAGFDIVGSGHAMVFYSFAALVNWAAVKRSDAGIDWVCERGHTLSPSDKFCSECGAPARIRATSDNPAAWRPHR